MNVKPCLSNVFDKRNPPSWHYVKPGLSELRWLIHLVEKVWISWPDDFPLDHEMKGGWLPLKEVWQNIWTTSGFIPHMLSARTPSFRMSEEHWGSPIEHNTYITDTLQITFQGQGNAFLSIGKTKWNLEILRRKYGSSVWAATVAKSVKGIKKYNYCIYIYINDLIDLLPPDSHPTLFADDLKLFSDTSPVFIPGSKSLVVSRLLQWSLDQLLLWSLMWQLPVSIPKCSILYITNSKLIRSRHYLIANHSLPQVSPYSLYCQKSL